MKWINLETTTIRLPPYIGSNPTKRATWFCVLAYACEIECGGRLVGAVRWSSRQWQQACGVTRREVMAADKLLLVDGQDIVVWMYPADREAELAAQRAAGSRGAKKRWHQEPHADPNRDPIRDPTRVPNGVANAEWNRKGKEEKRIPPNPPTGGVGMGVPPSDGQGAPAPEDPDAKPVGAVIHWVEHASKLADAIGAKAGFRHTAQDVASWTRAFHHLECRKGVERCDLINFVPWYVERLAEDWPTLPVLSTPKDLVNKWPALMAAVDRWQKEPQK